MQELLGLLQEAGHTDLRDARGPMGFTQRQSAGKFTRDEATAFIDLLQERAGGGAVAPSPGLGSSQAPAVEEAAGLAATRRLPSEQLAAELRRRGWTVVEP